ncbi:MAG: GNAT family N-acyltransferase [Pseudomonadota bacterium]
MSAIPERLPQHTRLRSSAPITAGHYEVRMASSAWEIREAQRLRYRLLYLERGGRPDAEKTQTEADADEWDENAYHVIVVDRRDAAERVVGTLRMVAAADLQDGQRFYTEQAFDLTRLRQRYDRLLELGRFCIDGTRRQGTILLLIWKFAAQFIVDNEIDVMLGCASFPGTNLADHEQILGYLHRHNRASPELMPTPRVVDYVQLAQFEDPTLEFDNATRKLPTLLRGYLKLGARVSDTAIIDPVFNTVFVCIYVTAHDMLEGNTPLVQSKHRNS